MISYLLSGISPGNSFAKKIIELLNKYPKLPRYYMGFTDDWMNEELWKIN